MRHALAVVAIALLALAPSAGAAPTLRWALVAERPHDSTAFTQGLVAHDGILLESTGLYGESTVRRVDPATGAVLRSVDLPASQFGEGLAVLRGTALQLTWTNRVLHAYDPATLARTGTRAYRWEGWGLTARRGLLVASDGSARLRFLDPDTLRVVRSVVVRDGSRPIARLNELELIDGLIWANVWMDDRIALIDPTDGRVRAWVDGAALRRRLPTTGEAFNGIARDPVTGHVAVTGKLWPRLFVIRLLEPVPR